MQNNEDDSRMPFKISESSNFELRLEHDKSCHDSRRKFEDLLRLELRVHSDRLNKLNLQYESRTDETLAQIDARIEKAIARQSREYADAVDETRRLGSEKLEQNLERLKRDKARLSKLTECVKSQEKVLSIARKRNMELTTPVKRLEAEISQMSKEIEVYNRVMKPELDKVKKRVLSLKKEIKERSFFLECLIQRNLLLAEQKNNRAVCGPHLIHSIDEVLDNMSVAETSASFYHFVVSFFHSHVPSW